MCVFILYVHIYLYLHILLMHLFMERCAYQELTTWRRQLPDSFFGLRNYYFAYVAIGFNFVEEKKNKCGDLGQLSMCTAIND